MIILEEEEELVGAGFFSYINGMIESVAAAGAQSPTEHVVDTGAHGYSRLDDLWKRRMIFLLHQNIFFERYSSKGGEGRGLPGRRLACE